MNAVNRMQTKTGTHHPTPALESARSIAAALPGRAARPAGQPKPVDDNAPLEALIELVEGRLVEATWTLRRLPDRERGFLRLRTMVWPDAVSTSGDYAPAAMTAMQARRAVRIDPREIDRMQPALDLLQLLPDVTDRQLLFWAAWHQDGERRAKLPWAKVRRSLQLDLSRWTLKRRYENGLRWLASIILAQ